MNQCDIKDCKNQAVKGRLCESCYAALPLSSKIMLYCFSWTGIITILAILLPLNLLLQEPEEPSYEDIYGRERPSDLIMEMYEDPSAWEDTIKNSYK